MKQVLKCFNVVTMITLLLSIILPSPSAFATEINKKSWDELQGNDVKIKADQVNAEMYKGEVAEREHVFQYKIENTGDTPIRELVIKQNNDNGIEFLSQSMKVNGEKLLENKVADFYVEEKDNGGKVLSSNLKIQDLKSHEKMTVLIKARRAQHFNKEYKQKISVQKDQLQIGNMSVDVEGLPSEEKLEANTDDEADSSKKAIGSTTDSKTKEVDGKLKVSVEDKNTSAQKTEIEKIKQPEAEKQLEKEKKQSPLAVKQSDAEVQAASENASKVQIQTGDKQGFGDPLYSTIAPGNLVQTGNVTLGLTSDHYGRQSMGYKTNKMTVDVDNDDSTFNSSTGAFPNIPAGSKVKKAYLFWTAAMGLPGNIADRKVTEDQVRQPVKMRMGNKEYAEVTADSIRKADYLPYISNYSGSGAGYVAYAEVTNIIAQQGISQTLTVANVPQIKDVTGGGYYWGNWNLILVYENYKETVKDMKIWEGLVSQKSTAWTDISVNKINTPKEGAFKAKFSYFSSQGDPADNDGYAYDYGEYDFGLGYQKFKNIKGKDNDVNDSSMTEVQVDGTNEFVTKKYPGYNPDWTNSFSTDIHTYHLEGPTQVKNDLKEGKMRFRAYGGGGDIYVLNNATFVTEHNAPNLQVDKKALDSTGKEVKEIKAGEEFTYQIEVKNDTKNNQAPVSNVKGFDKLDDRLEYVPGSIQYVSGSSKGNKTDDASDDEAEFVNNQIDFRVGEGANAKDGGVLKPGESTVITFKVKVKDSVQSDTTVKNVVVVKGQDSAEIKYETEDDANVTVTTLKEVPGEIEARKIASNKTPKLGDEVEYRITFKNKTKDGRLDVLTIEDELPSSLEYVKDSLKAEGAKPEPVELKFENGKVIAKYPEIMDMEERSIVFKTKVKETAKIGEEIVNKATVRDKTNPPKNLEEKITPQHKAGKIAAKKKATNKKPRLGEEVEYQISFKNTVDNGKLDAVTIEDEIPANLEFVQGSVRAEGTEPNPVELKVENGKVIAKYPEITDTKERSIAFKVKVKDSAKVGEAIVNKAIAKDPKNEPVESKVVITPQSKKGEIAATKVVNNKKPKLGEEIEYRISFHNTVENGKLETVRVEDTIPKGLEYVENSIKAEGEAPEPVELAVENGIVKAKYIDIMDMKERSIVFKVKVKEEVKVDKEIVNKAIVDDTKNPPIEPEERITPQHKDGIIDSKKTVDNPSPKLGEEVEYRISFKNTVENGKLEKVIIEDTIPNGLEYVKGSEKAEGDKPAPLKLSVKDGKVIAEYDNITDMKERSIVFKVKVKEEAEVGKEIINKAIVDDMKDPKEPEAKITPLHKDGKIKAKKIVNNETPKLGEEVEYRISMKNTVKNGKLTDVTVEDTLPEGLEYVENSLKAEGAGIDSVELKFENGKVMAKYPEITDTEERSIVFKVKVKEEVKVGKKIINKATIDDSQNKPVNPTAEITPQYKDGKLEAKKIVNNETPKLGEEVEYRISFKNTVEHGKLTEVKIEDDLPNGLEYVKNSLKVEGSKPDPVELKFENGKVMAKYPEITDTKERSITFKVKVKGKVSDSIVNEAIVSDTKHPPETPTAEIIPQHKDGKVKAKKTVNNETPKLGEEVEYRISFKNTVEDGKLAEVKIEDTLPEGLEYVENSVKAEGTKPDPVELKMENGKVMAKYPEITDTEERSITFKVKVKEEVKVGKKIVNKAIVDDTKNEPETPTAEITPQHKDGKVEAKKTVNNETPKLGEEVEYRISFKNTVENGKLAEVNIKDALPNGLEYVEGSITAEGSKPKPVELHVKNNKVMAKYPEITDTEERSIVFKAKVKESVKVGEEIVNEAIVDDTKNLPEEPYVPITPQYKDGKIEARKEVSNHEPKLGEEIEYRIIFNNTVKDGKLAEVKIEDKIPAGLEFVEGSEKAEGEEPKPVELKVENGKVMAKYSEIMDTQERSIVFKVKVKDSVTIGKDITNKAIIHVDDPNHPVIDPTAKITPQYKDGKIAAHKKVNNHKPKLGEEIEYRISFNNTVKDGKLAEVKIEDEIPFGLEYVKDSLKAEGDKPAPVELKEEAGKVSAKYENITDMKERSIIFKVKVKDSVEVDKAIVNKAIVDDTKNPPERPEVDITPQHKDGKFKANKKVSKKDPKLGEEVEYRISFKNTVENGKLAEVKIEDQLPNGLEYVKDSLKAEGNEPNPVELKEEAGKITAKYENITDTAERSIIFKVKVTEAVKVGKKIVNTAIVDDDHPKNPPQKPEAIITPEYKNGKIKAEKTVNNPAPKLGEEVEYRITFRNVVEHGKLAKVKIKDELPNSLEFVEGSERAEGDNPKPLHVKVKNGIVLAEYPEITDTKERSIVFKAKVKEKAKIGEAIVNTAVVEDTINPPEKPNVAIQPQHKEGVLQAEKTVSNHEPKLGEEVEYRISFENTVENGKLTEVKVEDEIPAGLEYVQDSIKSDGPEPNPVELKVENGKVTAKYPEITDTKKRSIIFKVKVQETVQVGKEIINKAVVDDNNPTNPPVESLIPITPQYKDGKLEARKEVSNHEPKLGEEIEYRITFNGTVDGGKLVDVKIEDEIPSGLEYVKESLEAVGDKPVPTELKVENGKVTVKYPEIMDTKERSIIFKVKVKESVKVGEEITNKAIIHVDDPDHPVMEPTATIKPEYKDGKLKATKTVNNKEPKLGEEVEYRISFKNTVENGKLAEVKVEDEIPAGLEYVQDSIRFEGAEPNPIELKMEFGKVIAKYLEITDTKERSIIFKVKVKAAPSKGITNRAVVDDKINPPLEPTVTILPKTKEDLKIPEEPKEPEVKPEEPKEPKEPEVKPEEPKEPKEPEVKPEEPKEPKEPEVKPEEPKDLKKPEVKPEVRLEKLIKEPQVKVEKELPKTGAAHSWMMSVGAGISFLVGGVLFVLGRRRKQ
ncbi:cell surface protein [Bacillus cereus]|uniref:isopeptide-forming domain-containing fimbrial protein n=1 Tax=Bacillus cereus TaxID=1396 RepID=UPI000BFE7327|nr:isopeptide-forming domain-containing fimbrial protein [Bacillus cereus]PGV13188.1 cell surface protein [Bacillus cereus]